MALGTERNDDVSRLECRNTVHYETAKLFLLRQRGRRQKWGGGPGRGLGPIGHRAVQIALLVPL